MKVSKKALETLLRTHRCTLYGVVHGKEVWLTEDSLIIRLPNDEREIHIDIIEPIIFDILEMNVWDYDYWLGQNCLN